MSSISENKSAWLGWFDGIDNEEAIRRLSYRPAPPIQDLGTMHIDDACRHLNRSWEQLFIADPQHVKILGTLVRHARAFADVTFPTIAAYNALRESNIVPEETTQTVLCLTGLSGVSKSSLMEAFVRICQADQAHSFESPGQTLRILPVVRVKVDAHASYADLLRSLANPLVTAGEQRQNLAHLHRHVQDWLLAQATAFVVSDEMQFLTSSAEASTRTTQLILSLGKLGFPFLYVANYSLVNKLLRRPHEEKSRILGRPLVLHPPLADSETWAAAVREYFKVSPESFHSELHGALQELHRLTAGLYRSLVHLLLEAYRIAREQGGMSVKMGDVRRAYRSSAYSSFRRDVEDLASLAVSNLRADRRPDLICPFPEIDEYSSRDSLEKGIPGPIPKIDLPAANVESTLSVGAVKALKEIRQAVEQRAPGKPKATVTRLPTRTGISAQSLRAGASLVRHGLAVSPASVKPGPDPIPPGPM